LFGGSSEERNIRATIKASGTEHPTQTARITNSVVIIMASGELLCGRSCCVERTHIESG